MIELNHRDTECTEIKEEKGENLRVLCVSVMNSDNK